MQAVERKFPARDDLISGTKRRFHDPASVGENVGRARGGAKQPVHLPVGEVD